MCTCSVGYTGDSFTQCEPVRLAAIEVVNPCQPSPCGTNAVCTERNGAGACQCLAEYLGNPYDSCRPECVLNSDCPANKACQNQKCVDPCPGTCGQNAECNVANHIPTCNCFIGYVGDPYRNCNKPAERKIVNSEFFS